MQLYHILATQAGRELLVGVGFHFTQLLAVQLGPHPARANRIDTNPGGREIEGHAIHQKLLGSFRGVVATLFRLANVGRD